MSLADVASIVPALLDTIHDALFAAAKKGRDDKMVTVTKWDDFVPALEKQCLVMTPFCDVREWEEKVKVSSECCCSWRKWSCVPISVQLYDCATDLFVRVCPCICLRPCPARKA